MPKRFRLLLAGLALAATPFMALAAAPTGHAPPWPVAVRDSCAGLSLNQAVQQVQRQTGGRVLSADQYQQGGRTYYRIKVLTPNGQVRVVTVDAQSGSGR
jgi:hypothetical protein